jgi:RNA polymerase sigma factor (sigma-70 family)
MTYALDVLVRQAQRGDHSALERLSAALRGPLMRHLRRLGIPRDEAEDVVQEALMDIVRGIAGYRWQASFLSWCYAVATRRAVREARRSTARAARCVELVEESMVDPPDPLAPDEAVLVEQAGGLTCAFVVARRLAPQARHAYLLGDVLNVPDRVGAEVCGCSPAAFRQRVSRARREVEAAIRASLAGEHAPGSGVDVEQAELDRLVRLGELHRASGRGATAPQALAAARRVAPELLA